MHPLAAPASRAKTILIVGDVTANLDVVSRQPCRRKQEAMNEVQAVRSIEIPRVAPPARPSRGGRSVSIADPSGWDNGIGIAPEYFGRMPKETGGGHE